MLKGFLMKKMLASKIAGLPEEEREKAVRAIEENPELFAKIAEEMEAAIKAGKSQTDVAMEIAQKYGEELKRLM
jgi:hypothetical protein